MKKRVLVVENEPDVRRTLDKVLSLAGFSVLPAADGRAGRRAVHTPEGHHQGRHPDPGVRRFSA